MRDWDEEDWQAFYDERAGIMEYDAGFPRAKAEALARQEVRKIRALVHVTLHPAAAPA
jgi:hypothetical protein